MNDKALNKTLGAELLKEQLVTEWQLEKALEEQRRNKTPLRKALLAMKSVSEEDLARIIGRLIKVEYVEIEPGKLDSKLVRSIQEHLAKRYKVIPVGLNGDKLRLAMADPQDVIAIDDIRLISGREVEPLIAAENAIMKAIDYQYQ